MTVTDTTRSAGYASPDSVAFIVVTDHRPVTFQVVEEAFGRWIAGKGDPDGADPPEWLPDWADGEAGARLTRLFLDAKCHGVIDGDPDIEVNVYGDDDGETSGFYVILSNRAGGQTALGLTSGWQELLHLDDLPPRRRVRAYLDEICTIVNFTLAKLQVAGRR